MKSRYAGVVAICTTTFKLANPKPEQVDDNNRRAEQALKSIRMWVEAGYLVGVVDGPGCPEFRKELIATGADLVVEQKPVPLDKRAHSKGLSRQECMRLVLDSFELAQAWAWIEPEKYTFKVADIDRCFDRVFSGASLVVPHRGVLVSYPSFQSFTENFGNFIINNRIHRPDLDLYSGPRFGTHEAFEMMARYDGVIEGKQILGHSWHILFIPVLWMIKNGWRIDSVPIDYTHPPEQTVAEEGLVWDQKRLRQLDELVRDMLTETDRIGL